MNDDLLDWVKDNGRTFLIAMNVKLYLQGNSGMSDDILRNSIPHGVTSSELEEALESFESQGHRISLEDRKKVYKWLGLNPE
ncbi:hypothetical protein [Shimazuella alba]|uniref:Uncharacterized protein n=1 Tax=Shimazuella alba TaxID=2690964 RepID=A0A6I4VXH0_9BACL|nr:hypothetical protein [Shimazuella alba]MXQ53154.1 hypothetical protein [Shimazuella alba]